jgi:hypothetical protein
MGGRALFVVGMLALACGGESHSRDTSSGSSSTGGSDPTGGSSSMGGSTSMGGSDPTGGGAGAAGGGAVPGGFSRDAARIGDAWPNGVIERCRNCNPETPEGCIAEDGFLVPWPFLLICLSQLAATDPEIAAFLARWAIEAEATAAAWSDGCEQVPNLPPPLELPASAASCSTREFGCPEGVTATACDGVSQCIVGEDEGFCGPIADAYTCHHGEMFAWTRICNGVPECEFGEDERTCPALASP